MKKKGVNFALDKGIQCLLYWLGYKRYIGGFGGSKCENAIRDELQQNILPCLLDSDYVVLKEIPYVTIFNQNSGYFSKINGKKADIAILAEKLNITTNNSNIGCNKSVAKVIIEIKLQKSSFSLKKKDIERLWMIKQENQNIKTYLLVISEIGLPTEYVNPVTGKVLGKGKIYLIGNQYKYKVKRVASLVDHKVNEKDLIVPENALEKLFSKGAYACLIEVL